MYAKDSKRIDVLRMCEDCRVAVVTEEEFDPHGAPPRHVAKKPPTRRGALMRNRPLLIFAGCLLLFHLANSAMLPLVGSVVTTKSARSAS